MFQAFFSLNQDSVGCGRCSQHTYLVQSTDSQSFIFSLSGSRLNSPSGSASESSGGGGREGGTQKEEGGLTSSILFHLLLLIFRWEVHRKHCMSLSSLVKCVVLFTCGFLLNDVFSKEEANNTLNYLIVRTSTCMKRSFETTSTKKFLQQVRCSCRCWGKIIFRITNKQFICMGVHFCYIRTKISCFGKSYWWHKK